MSDEPLFQNTDVQEAAYAPSGPDPERSGDQVDDEANVPGSSVVIPAAGLAAAGGLGVSGTGTSVGAGAGAVGPAIAGVALAGGVDDDEENRGASNDADKAPGQTPPS